MKFNSVISSHILFQRRFLKVETNSIAELRAHKVCNSLDLEYETS